MSEEFETWWRDENNTLIKDKTICTHFDLSKLAWDYQQAKIDAQTKELEALRGFAKSVMPIIDYNNGFLHWFEVRQVGQAYKLIDQNGNPTTLLNGGD